MAAVGGGGALPPRTMGAVPTRLHQQWERVALCIMETRIASNKLKRADTTLAHSRAGVVLQTRHVVKYINELNIIEIKT